MNCVHRFSFLPQILSLYGKYISVFVLFETPYISSIGQRLHCLMNIRRFGIATTLPRAFLYNEYDTKNNEFDSTEFLETKSNSIVRSDCVLLWEWAQWQRIWNCNSRTQLFRMFAPQEVITNIIHWNSTDFLANSHSHFHFHVKYYASSSIWMTRCILYIYLMIYLRFV